MAYFCFGILEVIKVGFHIALGPVQSPPQLDRLWQPAIGEVEVNGETLTAAKF